MEKKELISNREAREGDFGIAPVRMIGNLGAEPNATYTRSGRAVTRFNIAVWVGKGGESRWFRCVVWDDLAEEAREKLHKGTRIEVAGRLSFNLWQGKDIYEINVNWIQILVKPLVSILVEEIEANRTGLNAEGTPF